MSEPSFYRWEVKGSPVAVELSLSLIDQLKAVVQQSASIPEPTETPRGREIGGVLLGNKRDAHTVVVNDFELLPCEHRRGASYELSSTDRTKLGSRLNKLGKKTRDQNLPVGFFRSHTRSGLYLDQSDHALLKQYFSESWQVTLVVRPSLEGSPVAGLFFWENGEMDRHRTYLPFPFDSHLLVTEGHPVLQDEEETKETPSQQGVPERAKATFKSRKHSLITVAACLAAALFVPGSVFLATGLWTRSYRPRRISSQRKLPRVAKHKKEDSTSPLIAEKNTAPLPVPKDASVEPEAVYVQVPIRRKQQKSRILSQPTSSPSTAAGTFSYLESVPPLPKNIEPTRAIRAEPSREPPVTSVIAAMLPILPSVWLEPIRASLFRRTVHHIPLLSKLQKNRFKEGGDFSPAQPIHLDTLTVSPEELPALPNHIPVDLRIRITKEGKVSEAEMVSRSVTPALAESTIHAASHWDFEPARIGDKAVASEMFAHFTFSK